MRFSFRRRATSRPKPVDASTATDHTNANASPEPWPDRASSTPPLTSSATVPAAAIQGRRIRRIISTRVRAHNRATTGTR